MNISNRFIGELNAVKRQNEAAAQDGQAQATIAKDTKAD